MALTLRDVIDNISEVLAGADGDDVAALYNSICSDKISYQGDSLFESAKDSSESSQNSQKPQSLEIRKVLVLSTGHLTKETCLFYRKWPYIAGFEEGCYFYVGADNNQYPNAPADLQCADGKYSWLATT